MMSNMQKTICAENDCVGCNACILVCPKKCVSVNHDNIFSENRVKDMNTCISCQRCEKVCPQMSMPEGHLSFTCYAAWSLNESDRKEAASGGVATELYHSFAQNGHLFSGVRFTDDYTLKYVLTDNPEDILMFKNSKYVFSDTSNIYVEIGRELTVGRTILFIGLPCHVAGLKKYLALLSVDDDKLFTVDLVCHGTCPPTLLNEHVQAIENRYNRKATRILFRNPKYGTNNYFFTLEDNDGIFYQKPVDRNDAYQIGYHAGIIYRENCYNCHYAKKERQGDLTLSDFSGIGKIEGFSHDKNSISCVLVNTEKGQRLVQMISNSVYLEERPLEEEWNYERQLSRPTERTAQHQLFLTEYHNTSDFQHSIRTIMRKQIWRNELRSVLRVKMIKKALRRIMPDVVVKTIKKS